MSQKMTKPETEKLIELEASWRKKATNRSVDEWKMLVTCANELRDALAALHAQGGGGEYKFGLVPPLYTTSAPAPDAVEWSPSNAFDMRVRSYCPACPCYLEPRARLIDKRGLLHCERCKSGSYGFVQAACGGCGETNEENRCIGCLHQFAHARSAGGEGNVD